MVWYCWISGLCPLSSFLKEYSVSETRSVSVFRWKGEEAPTQLILLKIDNLSKVIDMQKPCIRKDVLDAHKHSNTVIWKLTNYTMNNNF
jgi:hypothetical protein